MFSGGTPAATFSNLLKNSFTIWGDTAALDLLNRLAPLIVSSLWRFMKPKTKSGPGRLFGNLKPYHKELVLVLLEYIFTF